MIKGTGFHLRTITEADLPAFSAHQTNIANRGDYYPGIIHTEHEIRQHFNENGFWSHNHGKLLIVNDAGNIIGDIEFFKPVPYWNVYEIAYILFDENERGKGITTEATRLLTRYLFETRTINRIQLCVHPQNTASRRVAEKCGYNYESTARGVWFHKGKHHDMDTFVIFRDEVIE